MTNIISPQNSTFSLTDGFRPASNGKVYIGKAGTDPTVANNQITVTGIKSDGTTITLAQPISLSSLGKPVDSNGNAVDLVVDTHYSYATFDYYGKLQQSISTQLVLEVDSFTTLRALPVFYEGQRVTLLGWSKGSNLGGGTFVGHKGTKSDDGGSVAASSGYYWERVFNGGNIIPEMFGARSNGGVADAHTNSFAFQMALIYLQSKGGGSLVCSQGGTYYLDYPIYIQDNIDFDLSGSELTFVNPVFRKGRGGVVIGSSYEANREKAISNYLAGTYPTATTENTAFVNPVIKQYLRDNLSFTQAKNSRIHNGRLTAYFDGTDGTNGGYGVNMVNSLNCFANDLVFTGWTQAIGMGSDTNKETPSNHDCHAYNLTVIQGDLVKTYYAVGFIANSTKCSLVNTILVNPLTDGTDNGSIIATNYVEYCRIDGLYCNSLGATESSEGVLLNNAKGCKVTNIHVSNSTSAVSTYYTDSTFNDATAPNFIEGVSGDNILVSLRAKYAVVNNLLPKDATTVEIYFGNSNASGNIIKSHVKVITYGGSTYQSTYLQNNTVTGWVREYIYLRPIDILMNDKVDLNNTWLNSENKYYCPSLADKNLYFSYNLPPDVKAVDDVRCAGVFNTGALTKGTVAEIGIRRWVAFDYNEGTALVTEFNNTRAAASDTATTWTLVSQMAAVSPGLVLSSDTTKGLAKTLQFYANIINNVINNRFVQFRIAVYR